MMKKVKAAWGRYWSLVYATTIRTIRAKRFEAAAQAKMCGYSEFVKAILTIVLTGAQTVMVITTEIVNILLIINLFTRFWFTIGIIVNIIEMQLYTVIYQWMCKKAREFGFIYYDVSKMM